MDGYVLPMRGFESLDDQLSVIDCTISNVEEFLMSAFSDSIAQIYLRDLKMGLKRLKEVAGQYKDFKPILCRMIVRMDDPSDDDYRFGQNEDDIGSQEIDLNGTLREVDEKVDWADDLLRESGLVLWKLEQTLMVVVRDKATDRTPLCVLEDEPPLWQALRQSIQARTYCYFLRHLIQSWHAIEFLDRIPDEPNWNEDE
jgi:hypothetical protein